MIKKKQQQNFTTRCCNILNGVSYCTAAKEHYSYFSKGLWDNTVVDVLTDCPLLSFTMIFCRSRAAADTAQMKDAEELLFEVKNLEITLRNKKKHLLAQLDIITARLMNHF